MIVSIKLNDIFLNFFLLDWWYIYNYVKFGYVVVIMLESLISFSYLFLKLKDLNL